MATAASEHPLLSCRALSVGLGPTSAKSSKDPSTTAIGAPLLDALEFDVAAGECVAVVAPSGAGKSTLLRSLARLHPFVTGSITLDGVPCETIAAPSFRRRVHYVAQRAAFGADRVRDEILKPHSFASASGGAPVASTIERALEEVGLEQGLLDRKADVLSEGEGQRVSLVRSLLIAPQVLLLDEPTSALDKDSRLKVEDVIRNFLSPTTAVILVSHDEEQIERLGARAIDLGQFVVNPAAKHGAAS